MLAVVACGPKVAVTDPVAGESSLPDTLQLGDLANSLEGMEGAAPDDATVSAEDVLVPVGVWVTDGTTPGFTYVDPTEGLSMKTVVAVPEELAEQLDGLQVDGMNMIVRLRWRGPEMRVLTPEGRRQLGLPKRPGWLKHYGPQPKPGTLWGTWRLDPRLRGRFHPEYPDDIQVVFDDTPSTGRFEVMWVRVRACGANRCVGTLLNAPFHLEDLDAGDEVGFTLGADPQHFLLADGLVGPLIDRPE